jgi:hypothetical protein
MRHLELIQAVISRQGNNGFAIKAWSLTLLAALLGGAVEFENPGLALIAVLTTLTFWGLDAYFLRCERLFRNLYERVIDGDPEVPAFYMAATSRKFSKAAPPSDRAWTQIIRRPSLLPLYGISLLAALAITATIGLTGKSQSGALPITSPTQTAPSSTLLPAPTAVPNATQTVSPQSLAPSTSPGSSLASPT